MTRRTYPAAESGLKPKDLAGMPWMVAFALRADGWYLRSDIIWSKPNPMPESVTDRPTKAHEYVFLLSKRPRYWFDAEAVREPHAEVSIARAGRARLTPYEAPGQTPQRRNGDADGLNPSGRNVRSVWQIATQPYAEAHFATYPEELVRRCLLAGCPVRVCRVCGRPSERLVEDDPEYAAVKAALREKRTGMRSSDLETFGLSQGTGAPNPSISRATVDAGWSDCGHNAWRPGRVLDPFLGSGTTAKVARDHGRHCWGVELNQAYAELAARRLQQLSLLAERSA